MLKVERWNLRFTLRLNGWIDHMAYYDKKKLVELVPT
jgi:hypothetical protein